MIKNILLVSLLLAGGTLWAPAQSQTTEGAATSLPVCKKENMTISQLFQKVEDNSKSLRTSLSGVEAAHLGIESAKSKKLPDLDASLSFSYIGNALITDRDFSNVHGLKSPHFGNNFAFQAQQVVYAGGAINAGIKLAELGKQQAKVGVKLTRQQIRFIALGQYLDLYKIDNRIKVYEKNIELTRQLIDDIKEKQTHGMALKNDITRYELQMESLKLGLTALRNNRSILNHQLCNTLGMNQDSQMNQGNQEIQIIPDATIADKTYGKEGEAYWQTAGTLNSPLLEQSSNAIRIAEQKEKIAKSDLLPKVAFVAADNFDGPILFELPPVDKNLNVWYVGVGVKYSLSSLFKSNKRIKQAAVETRQAKEAHAVQAEQLNNNVQAAYVQYQQTYVELETQRKSVELAQQNYDVMNARYLSQLALVTDMVDASNLKLNAELSEVDARINIVYAYYRMKYVAGEI
nr:TolC family protein [uncultured Prevotella sp.]